MAEPYPTINNQLHLTTLEVLFKSLAGLVLRSSQDPNAQAYLWNTFENSVDALTAEGMPDDVAMHSREKIREYGQAVLRSVTEGM